ncbi:MAG TPA: methyltransferase domain-containing protein [Mucilaginibacter sp.]|nr:methyltransferase domain-containing protein [Mucilaginibacter sp.]
MKLHLGCGKNIKDGYINIDKYVTAPGVENLDILNLPYEDESAEEILSEHLVEHIGFEDEEKFWRECARLLKSGGKLITETPDMEWLCKQFMEAEDSFIEFYQVGAEDHYFGNGCSITQRWGILTTHLFGNQNGDGQFHHNAYTEKKLLRIAEMINMTSCEVSKHFSKGCQTLIATMTK